MRKIYELGMKSKKEEIEQRAQKIKQAYLKVMGNFTEEAVRPFHFYCSDSSTDKESSLYLREDVNAKALTCDLQKDHLGVVLNTDTFKKRTERQIKGTIFHELFHHAGYYHDHIKQDWVYGVELCCFGYDDASYMDLNSLGEQYSCGSLLSADHEDELPFSRQVNDTLDLLSGLK